MSGLFIDVINLSITASLLIIAVLVVRLLLKRAPKNLMCILWALAGIRLLIPFSFETAFSAAPAAQTVPEDIVISAEPFVDSGIGFIDEPINAVLSEKFTYDISSAVSPMQRAVDICSVVWLCGITLMLIYLGVSYLRVKNSVREAVNEAENLWICDSVKTPFILGVIFPRIYLPSDLGGDDREYVLAHERAHLKRLDHIWKPAGFILLTVHWFNPVIWLGYMYLCRDIEYACDEKVIKTLGEEGRKSYSEALVNCSAQRRLLTVCPLAFGEVGVKKRIVSVLNYKRPAFWVIVLAIAACTATVLLFMTNRPRSNGDGGDVPKEPQISEHIHSWGELTVKEAPGCETTGSGIRVCSECGEEKSERIEKTGHFLVENPPKNATCTESGYINYKVCRKCGYETKFILEPLGHTYGTARKCVRCPEYALYSQGLKMTEITGYKYSVTGRGTCTESCIDVPPEYNGKPVTVIEWLFHEDVRVKEVNLPDSIEKIGSYTFSEAFALEKVTMGNRVTVIGNNAFAECVSLKNIDLSDSITHIGGYAFRWCYKLEMLVIPKSVKRIYYGAFEKCDGLNYVVMEDPEGWNTDVDLTDPYVAAQWLKDPAEKKKS